MKHEIRLFIKRNRIQLLIASVCVILTVKQMNAPFPMQYNFVTSLLFERISENSRWFEVIEIINNLGFAYYSSLIFYFVVDYFPTRKKEKKALNLVKDHISDIIMHIDYLITALLFFTDLGTKMSCTKINLCQLQKMTSLQLTLKPIVCNVAIVNKQSGEVEMGSQCEELNSFDTVQRECVIILKEIDFIKNHIGASQIENELVDKLSLLSENCYLNNMRHLKREYIDDGRGGLVCAAQTSDLLDLLKIHSTLCKLALKQRVCIIEKSTDQDKKDVLKSLKELKKNHPEAMEMYEKMQSKMIENKYNGKS